MNKNIIFDFDGVFVNDLEVAWKLMQIPIPEMTLREYQNLFTGNVFANMSGEINNRIKESGFNYFDHYDEVVLPIAPTKNIESILKQLDPIKTSIISSTNSENIKRYLVKYNLDKYIGEILGADVDKSKDVKFIRVLSKFADLEPIFVTDTLGDIIEAHKLSIPTIAVTWGFHDGEMLEKGNPEFIVETVEELEKLLIGC